MLISNKIWEYKHQDINDNPDIGNIAEKFKVSNITATVLANRGLKEYEKIERFLNPSLSDFHNPFLLKGMNEAVERIVSALKNDERIVVYGDYDVDGISSTSVLLSFLREFGRNVDFFIPDRLEEGYGLSKNSIDKIAAKGADLIVTVDCGITAVDEVEYVKQLGIDIIVTDHHQCKDEIPNALAVINPKQKDCKYPFKELAGVGVVFKVVQALSKAMKCEERVNKFIELVTLGTIADVVPLLDENRVIVKFGLEKLNNTSNYGLKALIEVSGLAGKTITTTSVGYVLAPRINAAGRIGDAGKGVSLFLSKTEEESKRIAQELDQDNKSRQQTENIILNQAIEMVEGNPEFETQKVIVLASEGWHHGVIGIVASRITERYYKPSILISVEGEDGKGSGRSIPGFNIFEALKSCGEMFEKFGGHELAVGLSVKQHNIDEIRRRINSYADEVLSDDVFYSKVKIDCQLNKENVNLSLLNELKMLEPYGMGNPSPIFSYSGLKVVDSRTVGDNKHLKLRLEDEDLVIDSIGFNIGEYADKIDMFDKVDVAGNLEVNVWNNVEKIQINIKDIKTTSDVIFKEKYFNSLENVIFNKPVESEDEGETLSTIKAYDGGILSLAANEQKNVILINTLKGAKGFVESLKIADGQVKDKFKIYYNYFNDSKADKNIAVINPYMVGINFEIFDNVIMYDMCFNKCQYAYLLKNAKNVFVMKEFDNHTNNLAVFEDIIPQRDDLIQVYQFLKIRGRNDIISTDIFSLAREISISYNTNINSLKLKKILEIFHEMNLIVFNSIENSINIKFLTMNGGKVNITASKGLLKLMELKDEFGYFIDSLKNRQTS